MSKNNKEISLILDEILGAIQTVMMPYLILTWKIKYLQENPNGEQ